MSLALPSELTIYSLATLKEQWLAALPKPSKSKRAGADKGWSVDASAVTDVDAAGLQLLLSLAGELGKRHQTLHLADASQPLVDSCASLGLTSLLNAAGSRS